MTQDQLIKQRFEVANEIIEREIDNLKSQIQIIKATINQKEHQIKENEFQYQAYLEQLKSNPVEAGN